MPWPLNREKKINRHARRSLEQRSHDLVAASIKSAFALNGLTTCPLGKIQAVRRRHLGNQPALPKVVDSSAAPRWRGINGEVVGRRLTAGLIDFDGKAIVNNAGVSPTAAIELAGELARGGGLRLTGSSNSRHWS